MRRNFRNSEAIAPSARIALSMGLLMLSACLAVGEDVDAPDADAPSRPGASGGEAPGAADAGASKPDAGRGPNSDGGAGQPGADAGTEGPEAGGGAPGPTPRTPGYLHTRGAEIVDAQGNPVRITGINWFGLETNTFAPHGLWARPLGALLDQVKALGFNTLRLPYCNQLFDPGSRPNGFDANLNPELVGKSGLEIMDIIVREAGARGLKVFLDRHRPDAMGQSELWYTPQYPEDRWISDWRMLASRYKGNTTVIGFDLHNEPHGPATWGDGNMATDWRLAAERAGNAILEVNPELLIIVEGVERANGSNYWWGGNLRGVAQNPVNLRVPNQLVYSPHEYPASVFAQPWFSAPEYPNNLEGIWREHFGYIAETGLAPVLIGEFGSRFLTEVDQTWMRGLANYVMSRNLSFSFWSLNPNSGDTGGILQDDWMGVETAKQSVLSPVLAPLIP